MKGSSSDSPAMPPSPGRTPMTRPTETPSIMNIKRVGVSSSSSAPRMMSIMAGRSFRPARGPWRQKRTLWCWVRKLRTHSRASGEMVVAVW